jgi:ABC-type nitrate/sulfonate/bicarbonate transport system permease component
VTGHLRPLVTVVFIFALWWLASTLRWMSPLFLPSIPAVSEAAVSLLTGGNIYWDALATVYRAFAGLLLSSLIGVPLGLVFGLFPGLYRFIEMPVDFLRSIPSSALFFLFILFFGLGDAAKIAVVVYGCSLILLVNTIYGTKPSREKVDRINMLRSFRARPWQIFHLTILRDALPNVMAGLRVCVSLSLVLVVVTEMFLSANDGLGKRIYDFYLTYRIPEMYAVLILLGLIGFGANKIALILERRLSFWTPDTL